MFLVLLNEEDIKERGMGMFVIEFILFVFCVYGGVIEIWKENFFRVYFLYFMNILYIWCFLRIVFFLFIFCLSGVRFFYIYIFVFINY